MQLGFSKTAAAVVIKTPLPSYPPVQDFTAILLKVVCANFAAASSLFLAIKKGEVGILFVC